MIFVGVILLGRGHGGSVQSGGGAPRAQVRDADQQAHLRPGGWGGGITTKNEDNERNPSWFSSAWLYGWSAICSGGYRN